MKVVIVANGLFPTAKYCIDLIRNADRIVCCDGAVNNLLSVGLEPDYIIGDMDSLSDKLAERYRDRIYHDPDQETNDLTKSIAFCSNNNFDDVCILGATGLREDHTLGNISLLADYKKSIENIRMFTDYGRFEVVDRTTVFNSLPGQQISIFSLNQNEPLTTEGLLYPIKNRALTSWWQGTLNEATGSSFTIKIKKGPVIIYLLNERKKAE